MGELAMDDESTLLAAARSGDELLVVESGAASAGTGPAVAPELVAGVGVVGMVAWCLAEPLRGLLKGGKAGGKTGRGELRLMLGEKLSQAQQVLAEAKAAAMAANGGLQSKLAETERALAEGKEYAAQLEWQLAEPSSSEEVKELSRQLEERDRQLAEARAASEATASLAVERMQELADVARAADATAASLKAELADIKLKLELVERERQLSQTATRASESPATNEHAYSATKSYAAPRSASYEAYPGEQQIQQQERDLAAVEARAAQVELSLADSGLNSQLSELQRRLCHAQLEETLGAASAVAGAELSASERDAKKAVMAA